MQGPPGWRLCAVARPYLSLGSSRSHGAGHYPAAARFTALASPTAGSRAISSGCKPCAALRLMKLLMPRMLLE